MKTHNLILWISRLIVGLLFIFSGFIKANDPLGFSYKLVEYFQVFGMDFLSPVAVFLAIIICIVEIVLGVSIILGTFIYATTVILLLMIIFFTFLTGFSAITGAVSDCGCFGDAIKLTPTESFLKDILLLLLIGYLYFYRDNINLIMPKNVSRVILYTATIIITSFSLYTYLFLPIVDFRPYKVGNDIQQLMMIPEDAPKDEYAIYLVYERDGQVFEFPIEEMPEDIENYEWRETKTVLLVEGFKPSIIDFSIHSNEGENLTESFFSQKGYRLMVVQYDLPNANIKGQKDINQLIINLKAERWELPVWGLSSSTEVQKTEYREMYDVTYPFYVSDATVLKTIVRSNPGLVLFRDNTIVAKWPALNIPDARTLIQHMQ